MPTSATDLSQSILIDDPPDYVGNEHMEFHLLYAGDLLRSAGNTKRRPWEKHSLRRHVHEQLKKLWETNPALKYYADKTLEWEHKPPVRFMDHLAQNYERGGIGFIPITTELNGLVMSLNVLLLRPERPGAILDSAGDIDNRMKVFIDALRIPKDLSEMKRHEGDEPDPNPMYCLMADDRLVTSLKIETDMLLFTRGDSEHEAIVVIRVETAQVDPFGSPWELHL
jgi:hypothetical protein